MAAVTYNLHPDDIPHLPFGAIAVTPSDVTDYHDAGYAGGITVYVVVGGDLVVEAVLPTEAGAASVISITDFPAFTVLPFRVRKVKAATTATVIGLV